ncbi:PREDICTED: ethylene-responsive transcription factor ERF015 isoform X1 [Tarenaya hassleriana]|uniref:ethylene-responsive transcription factor ERF015 isoform X1 n=1 Tax=Tarenaya hassleriana TaxID=28532 RepID=UPI00053C948F|nr:PREDICTED: ethylene-responsive transcription factor ERF015 isoform X1 [Tarenaya hassleriana]XP_010525827.1 PREDICTED: ethylene-responsive transcription factor ERF015 isoform X1 [Tarenaya hassleriana]XP_010525830.1 PREDICTED: ethylene-responsive transcription factor ERF015 isoform X1 [Tarenaya hassleriana]XP_010525831.1 PREDICTED: ethylene-responsive transcription factor ERF015 isoform X1 [Tarenaya hassleriana]XP_010525832.1 PREDICTED: ethylene-responsive transcription factor ERF015 isoform X
MDMMPPSPPKSPFLSSSLEEVRRDGKFKCYKGVRKRAWGKWVSEIRVPRTGKRIWLGSYDAPEKAARAYDAALYCIRGERGVFNFPTDKKPQLPEGSSVQPLSRKDIQAIATSHASSHAPVSSHAATLTVTAQVPSHVPIPIPVPVVPVPVPVTTDLPVPTESVRIPEMVSEPYVPVNATADPIFSVEDLQLDNFLMMDIDWINDLL